MKTRHVQLVEITPAAGADLEPALGRLEALAGHAALAALHEWRVVADEHDALTIILASDDLGGLRAAWSEIRGWAEALGGAQPRITVGRTVFEAASGSPGGWDDFAALGPDGGLPRFAAAVSAAGMIWGLYGDTWARSDAVPELEALPFWPTADLATACIAGPWQDCVPRPIKVETLAEQWLPSMEEDRIAVVLLPTPTHTGLVVTARELATALAAPDRGALP